MRLEPKKTQLVIDGNVVVDDVLIAEKTISRMVGLLGRDGLPAGEAMFIKPCGSIHTVGMRFTLDIIFFDREMRVVRIACGVKPNRFSFGGRKARSVIEIESGWFDMSQVVDGTVVELRTAHV